MAPRLLLSEKGQDLAEYGLLGLLIVVVVVIAATLFGLNLFALFQAIVAALP